jgi:NAD(P)H-hydrate repair Nnr-like enzyme with NAD(P)H-hydrate dehydratase domain
MCREVDAMRRLIASLIFSLIFTLAASAAYIHNQAAERASAGAPINAEAIITAIPATMARLLKR